MTLALVFLHGFGVRYSLPIPLALYLYAAGGVVILSFLLVVLFLGTRTGAGRALHPRRRSRVLTAAARSRATRIIGGAVGVIGLLALIITGLLGSPKPTENPSEYLTWIFFWAGLVIICGLVGNLWVWVNPWTAIYDILTARRPSTPRRKLPDRLGIWPAVAVYYAFAGFELASGLANRPWIVGLLALLYSAVTLLGMALFGRDPWLERCEAFTVLFKIVGRFGPVETEWKPEGEVTAVWLRPWGTGLLQPIEAGWDRIAFIVLMLSSLAFDGIEATGAWAEFSNAMAMNLGVLGGAAPAVVKTIGLTALTVGFGVVFIAFMRLVNMLGGGSDQDLSRTTAFALTLVPIALVYNAAHNYDYLMIQAQGIIPLLNDPLARGWRLAPGLQHYTTNWALAGAATVWYMQVILIVAGHVLAVWLAHLRSTQLFRTARRALLSQYPMLLLMVAYTMTSLSILAQQTTTG